MLANSLVRSEPKSSDSKVDSSTSRFKKAAEAAAGIALMGHELYTGYRAGFGSTKQCLDKDAGKKSEASR